MSSREEAAIAVGASPPPAHSEEKYRKTIKPRNGGAAYEKEVFLPERNYEKAGITVDVAQVQHALQKANFRAGHHAAIIVASAIDYMLVELVRRGYQKLVADDLDKQRRKTDEEYKNGAPQGRRRMFDRDVYFAALQIAGLTGWVDKTKVSIADQKVALELGKLGLGTASRVRRRGPLDRTLSVEARRAQRELRQEQREPLEEGPIEQSEEEDVEYVPSSEESEGEGTESESGEEGEGEEGEGEEEEQGALNA